MPTEVSTADSPIEATAVPPRPSGGIGHERRFIGGLAAVPIGALGIQTIVEAEKIHDLAYTDEERTRVLATLPAQIACIRAIRAVPKERELFPALIFDPRLPGQACPPQVGSVRLKPASISRLPADEASIAYASVKEQSHWLQTGQISSRCLTGIYLERIARIAPALQCFVTVVPERALLQADRADDEIRSGRVRGPLHGVPYALKDVFDVAGIRTTWGADFRRGEVGQVNSAVAQLLDDAGAVLLGMAATGGLAIGSRWHGGDTRNPWNVEESASGSSTGSASAISAGLAGFAIGTDSLGSILVPSDRCGVVGLRATFGRVPTRGGMPLAPSLSRVGPITRSIEDAALVLAAINEHDAAAPDSIDMGFDYDGELDVSELTVGYVPQWYEQTVGFGAAAIVPVGAAQRQVLDRLRGMGVRLVEVRMPDLPIAAIAATVFAESAMVFEDLTLSNRDDELAAQESGVSWPDIWREIRLLSAVDYLQIQRVRRLLMEAMGRIFREVDILCGPLFGGSPDLLIATNLTGHPGLTQRVGFMDLPTRSLIGVIENPDGVKHRVPVNLTMHGRLFEEGKLLALGLRLEETFDVWREQPPSS